MPRRSRHAVQRQPMPERILECAFFIPMRRDKELADGKAHSKRAWRWLGRHLFDRFGGRTLAPGLFEGLWRSPATGQPVQDLSRRFLVAVPEGGVDQLRQLLSEACGVFAQRAIYLSVAGVVEFIEAPGHGQTF